MADTVDVKYLYPPNLSGSMSGKGVRRVVVRLTGISDGTGEIDVVKVDKSTLLGPNGREPTKFAIEEVEWAIQGFDYILLEFDHTSDSTIETLVLAGFKNYRDIGGLVDNGSGGTGDLILTSVGPTAGASYDISIVLRLKD